MSRTPLSSDELQEHLGEQFGFLKTSAQLFDAGHPSEAKRMATTIRVLLHNTRNSHGLMAQLGILDGWTWLDTAGPLDESNMLSSTNLVWTIFTQNRVDYEPLLGSHFEARRMTFQDWWNMVVLKDARGQVFTRFNLVDAVANRDGGAHVDPAIKEHEYALSRGNSVGWHNPRQDSPANPMLACIRQIGYEVLETVRLHSTS